MFSLILALVVLLLGFHFYGRLTEKVFAPDDRQTPAIAINDGVDCVPMKPWKAFLVQLLNIAGTGPIFGALMGACFGPVVFLWIVLGAILGGAVHDYMCGMISSRNKGASIAELSGIYMGKAAKWIMDAFSILLLVLTGTVFVNSPAALIANLTPGFLNEKIWIAIILLYYVLATLLPIDKLIGKLYPVFGGILILMAVSVLGGVIFGGHRIPEVTLSNLHPEGLPVWPFMFVTVACGAISGFYGATGGLHNALSTLGQSGTVYELSEKMLGTVGGILAIIGVVVCPITSGDTAFRSARLILAECTHLDQKIIRNRLIITLPLLAIGAVLTQLDFNVLWRYFSWSNQTLAMISLWVATAYLLKNGKSRYASLLTALPATFMSAVSMTYILMAKEGFGLSQTIAYPAGAVFAAALLVIYAFQFRRIQGNRKAEIRL